MPAHRSRRRHLVAFLAGGVLLLAACGDDDAAEVRTAPSEDAVSPTHEPDEGPSRDSRAAEATEDTGETADLAADDPTAAIPEACDLISADEVAAATGAEVAEFRTMPGSGSAQDVEYRTETCTFDLVEGEVDVRIFFTADGAPFGGEDFTALRAVSQDRRLTDDHPHEDVTGIGERAYFHASLMGNELVIDRGDVIIEVSGELAGEPMPRDLVRSLGAAATSS